MGGAATLGQKTLRRSEVYGSAAWSTALGLTGLSGVDKVSVGQMLFDQTARGANNRVGVMKRLDFVPKSKISSVFFG